MFVSIKNWPTSYIWHSRRFPPSWADADDARMFHSLSSINKIEESAESRCQDPPRCQADNEDDCSLPRKFRAVSKRLRVKDEIRPSCFGTSRKKSRKKRREISTNSGPRCSDLVAILMLILMDTTRRKPWILPTNLNA